jgi:hypothetical protein
MNESILDGISNISDIIHSTYHVNSRFKLMNIVFDGFSEDTSSCTLRDEHAVYNIVEGTNLNI